MKSDLLALDRLFKALADPTRVRILALLAGGQVCVCHIHETLKLPQPKTSRHLAYLRRAGLVTAEKRGLWVYYRIADQPAGPARTLLAAVRHCLGHLDTVQRDGARLEAKTGCCAPLAAPAPLVLDCCAQPAAATPRRPA